jgi:hypothetical protein
VNRFDSELGDCGLSNGPAFKQGNLMAFGAIYIFMGRKWGITVWAKDWEDADYYCARHGLRLEGEIVKVYDE